MAGDTEEISVEDAAIALDARIQAELKAIELGARELANRARRLGEGGRGVNGLATETVTWAKEFEGTADKVMAEGPEVSKALLGKTKHKITQTVNADLAVAAASDPERKR